MKPGLHCRRGDTQFLGYFWSGHILQVAHLIDQAVRFGQGRNGRAHQLFHLCGLHLRLDGGLLSGEFSSFRLQHGELQDREQGLTLPQLPANTAGDRGEPGAKGSGVTKLVEVPVGFEQGFDQDVLGILPIPADPDHLAVNGVLVLVDQELEVHAGIVACHKIAVSDCRYSGHVALLKSVAVRRVRFQGRRTSKAAIRHRSVIPAKVNPKPTNPARPSQ